MTNQPPGMIGLPCGELARYSDFLPSVIGLRKPPGTVFMKGTGLGPATPLNGIGRGFMAHPELQWLLLLNDDNLVPPDTIYRLLDRKVDVVSGLYFGRMQPFEPILFDKAEMVVNPDSPDGGERLWYHRHLMAKGEHGLVKAAAVGDGCLLIRRKVLETIPHPWWEYGETLVDACDHDVVFSRKVRDAGFGLYCDLDLMVDHIATFAVRPHRQPDGTWEAHLAQGDRKIELPAASRDMRVSDV